MASLTLSRVIIGFILVWIAVYILVYYMIMFPASSVNTFEAVSVPVPPDYRTNNRETTTLSLDNNLQKARDLLHINTENPSKLTNPFISEICQYSINSTYSYLDKTFKNKVVSVIIPTRNEHKRDLLNTIVSVIVNSGEYLKEIIIVDDLSNDKVTEWMMTELLSNTTPIKELQDFLPFIKILRPPHRLGVSGSKHFGSQSIDRKKTDLNEENVVVFIDAHTAVSKNWLVPLIKTLKDYPNAIVYPAIDVLYEDPTTGAIGFIEADNVLGSFDWALNFKWELIDNQANNIHKRMPLLTEIYPEHDEISTSPAAPGILAMKVEYYDTIGGFDSNLYLYGQDNIELSLRVWMCGGLVIRQPCSRVAHKYSNFQGDSTVGNGITQGIVDRNVMSIAERYMLPNYKEIVFQARFTNRVPYTVDLVQSDRYSSNLMKVEMMTHGKCQNFDWFLKEVFPGLLHEVSDVTAGFLEHINGGSYLTSAYSGLYKQYSKQSSDLIVVDEKVVEELHALANEEDEKSIQGYHDSFIPKKIPYMHPNLYQFKGLQAKGGKLLQPVDLHVDAVRIRRKGAVMSDEANNANGGGASVMPKKKKNSASAVAKSKPQAPVQGLGLVVNDQLVDPYTLQKKVAAGLVPESTVSSNGEAVCDLNNKPHGELLARVNIATPAPGAALDDSVKIFCGIYTMEKNHASNVLATRNTWARKCDGFLAFSTKTDLEIPAMEIKHEGEEAYDNMWQKSREIWKYIATHFINDFDYFVLGGDDMFYIVENLRSFLVSHDIQVLKEAGGGLYIGRRFYPADKQVFNSGGAGYTLDRVALKILVENIDSPKCFAHQHGFWEDVNVANCLRVSKGILPIDTRDILDRERFHPFTPGQHLTYKIPVNRESDWYPKYNPWLKEGFDCCSVESISFHYVPAALMYQLNDYVYHCQDKHLTNNFAK